MSLTGFANFEIGDLSEAAGTTVTEGSVLAISYSPVHSGRFALEVSPEAVDGSLASYQLGTYSSGVIVALGFPTSTTIYLRFYVYFASLPGGSSTYFEEFLSLIAGGSSSSPDLALQTNVNGKLEITCNGTVINSTANGIITTGSWLLVQLAFEIDTSLSSYNVSVGGTSVISGTQQYGSAACTAVYLGKNRDQHSQGYTAYFDDVAWSTTAMPGAGSGVLLVPTGSTLFQWSGDVTLLEQTPPYFEYATDSTSGDTMTLTMQTLASKGVSSNSVINGVKVIATGYGLVAGASIAIKPQISGSTPSYPTPTITGPNAPFGSFWAVNPVTSAAFTVSDVNGIVPTIANAANVQSNLNGVYVIVDYSPGTNQVVPSVFGSYFGSPGVPIVVDWSRSARQNYGL